MAGEVHHPVVAGVYDPVVRAWEVAGFREHRRYLADGMRGRTLNLGVGTGAMIRWIAGGGDAGDVELHGIEPDPAMLDRAVRAARDQGVPVRLVRGRAEALPYRSGAFDVVVCSLVFCTVADPDLGVGEVARVLRSGGEFRFVEHVRGGGWYGRVQDRVAPVWARVAGGCRLNRDTVDRFAATDAFETIELEHAPPGVPPVAPVVRGRFRRR